MPSLYFKCFSKVPVFRSAFALLPKTVCINGCIMSLCYFLIALRKWQQLEAGKYLGHWPTKCQKSLFIISARLQSRTPYHQQRKPFQKSILEISHNTCELVWHRAMWSHFPSLSAMSIVLWKVWVLIAGETWEREYSLICQHGSNINFLACQLWIVTEYREGVTWVSKPCPEEYERKQNLQFNCWVTFANYSI